MTSTIGRITDGGIGFFSFGLLQARVELVNRFTRWGALGNLLTPIVLVVVLLVVRPQDTFGTDYVLSLIAGITAAALFVGGFVGIAGELVAEQDDGTMLRVRTLPNGLSAYLVGKCASLLVTSLLTVTLVLVPTHIIVGGILPASPLGYLAFLGIAALALFSTVPLGALVGSLFSSPLAVLPMSMVAYGLMAMSGVFFPLSVLPEWLAVAVKAFPLYWLGLLSRSTLTPAFESIGTGETILAVAVPMIWAAIGLALVPRALRKMNQRQSGARLEVIQQRRATRGY
ncbi:ABC transporter permease [Agreia sp. COWG]|uniref:ABC transporter permease n=1 Tax=Agreia sp. COWG TaxID=2773266 RepID=UPI001925EF3A|nr:ABC transporter permease [Agreia sp. COWG]CAD5990962.1 ABC-2 type transport system permease protein [Agreia sp. COWG]